MENSIKISVIIPVYNVEQYLRECLNSVINQTYKNIEIICVDDCGSDNSNKILEDYSKEDSRIKIIHHAENKGLAMSRNTGIEAVTGDYIFFLDSDDYILPDTLKKLYETAESTKAEIVISKIKAFADDNTQDIINRTKQTNENLDRHARGTYQITAENYITVAIGLSVVAWGKLLSTKFIKDNQLRFIEQNAIHEDVGFWLKVCSCLPKIVSTDTVGVMYRIRGGSIMSVRKRKKSKQDLISNLNSAFDYFNEKHKDFSEELIKQIKNNECFCSIYDKKIGFLYRQRLLKDNKLITVLGVPIYREKIDKNKKKTIRIVGVPIYNKVIE